MPKDEINNLLNLSLFAFIAGSLGGIDAGFLEVLLISGFGASPANFSGLLFSTVSYGLLGAVIGIVIGFLLQLMPFHADRKRSRRYLGAIIAAASFSVILFLIMFFRAFRDFHAERVRYFEPTGLLTILIILVGTALLFILLRWIIAGPLRSFCSWFYRPFIYPITIAALVVVGLILNATLAKNTEEVHVPFTETDQAALKEKSCVIFIMVDTLRKDRLGCYGNSVIATPNIDALAADGILFEQMYSQASHTKPSTASMLTSRYPSGHRAIHKTDALPEGVTTMAEIYGQAGYYCGGIVTNINLAPVYNFQQGFHEYTYLPPDFFFGANEASSRLVIYGVLRLIRMKAVQSKWVYHFYQSGETVTGYFEDFLNRNRDRKFFLFLHYMDPHDPYFEHPYSGKGYARAAMPKPDPKFAEPFQDFYRQDIEYLDHWVGQVMSKLKEMGLYQNILIIFTSDHGEEFYEHGGWWHGTTLHEEQVRVPLLIKQPDNNGASNRIGTLTSSIDIAPTALRISGLNVPEEMEGRDLFAPPAIEEFIPEVFSEADHEGNVVQMLRIGPWKYIQTNPENPHGRPPQQLFNLAEDPQENQNLLEFESARVSEMQLLLKAKYQDILSTAVQGDLREMDQATQERLRALGYTQ